MSESKNFNKVLNQLKNKPGKMAKFLKHNSPKERKYGRLKSACRFTKNTHGVLGQYGIKMNRRLFRLSAKEIGFKKFN